MIGINWIHFHWVSKFGNFTHLIWMLQSTYHRWRLMRTQKAFDGFFWEKKAFISHWASIKSFPYKKNLTHFKTSLHIDSLTFDCDYESKNYDHKIFVWKFTISVWNSGDFGISFFFVRFLIVLRWKWLSYVTVKGSVLYNYFCYQFYKTIDRPTWVMGKKKNK